MSKDHSAFRSKERWGKGWDFSDSENLFIVPKILRIHQIYHYNLQYCLTTGLHSNKQNWKISRGNLAGCGDDDGDSLFLDAG